MAGQNDFLIFDENNENILTQEMYESDADRQNGFKRGLARSNVNNKVLRQTSTMAKAIGEFVKDNNEIASDSNLAQLTNALKNSFVSTKLTQTISGSKTFSNPISGTIDKALKDGNGDVFENTYVKKGDFSQQFHALKSYADNGELLTDAQGLSDVTNYAHSTFDVSKFAVNGTTGLTSDGIIPQGLTGSNTVRPNYLLPLWNNEQWEVITPLYTINPSGSNTHSMLRYLQGFYYEPAEANRDDGINLSYTNTTASIIFTFDAYYGTGSANKDTISGSISKPINNPLQFKMVNTGTQYELYYRENGFGAWISIGTQAKNHDFTNVHTEKMYTSWFSVSDYTMQGSTDLKYMSIKDNGVDVFSGNKTGVDTIKPVDFSAVANNVDYANPSLPFSQNGLTITVDGIASGFSGSNYLIAPTWNLSKPFELYIPFRLDSNAGSGTNTMFAYSNGLNNEGRFFFGIDVSNSKIRLSSTTNGTSFEERVIGNTTIAINTDYIIKIVYDLTKIYVYLSTDGGQTFNQEMSPMTTTIYTGLGYPVIGRYMGTSPNEFNGSIDLNAFKIYVDGNLVYQPCLKIPFTESKTGSKIVNSIYRDRVNDMADQFGYAPYYTLDEDNGNFTLPQVELYGYIEKRARDIAHPVAQPFFRLSDEINDDEIRLEGAEVDKGLYLAIEDILSDYCTAGSTPDKICLPDFRGRVPWGASDYGYISAGLPNISGGVKNIAFDTYDANNVTGAFNSISDVGSATGGTSGNERHCDFTFSATASNTIYGNSNTVQPPAFKVRWLARWK